MIACLRSLFSSLFFAWAVPLLRPSKAFDASDHAALPPSQDAEHTAARIAEQWQRHKHAPRPLFMALLATFRADIAEMVVLKMLQLCCTFVPPFLLSWLITLLQSHTDAHQLVSEGFILVMLFFFSSLAGALSLQHFFWRGVQLALKVRSGLVMAVHQKSMALHHAVQGRLAPGLVGQLTAVDVDNIMSIFWAQMHDAWACPLQIAVFSAMLLRVLGASALVAVVVLAIVVPMTANISKSNADAELHAAAAADERASTLGDALRNIAFIKCQQLEKVYVDRVRQPRRVQLASLEIMYSNELVNRMAALMAPYVVAATTFSAFVIFDGVLTAPIAFLALLLFNALQDPIARLPVASTLLTKAFVSMPRIEEFLLLPEREQYSDIALIDSPFEISDGQFTWDLLHRMPPALSASRTTVDVRPDWQTALDTVRTVCGAVVCFSPRWSLARVCSAVRSTRATTNTHARPVVNMQPMCENVNRRSTKMRLLSCHQDSTSASASANGVDSALSDGHSGLGVGSDGDGDGDGHVLTGSVFPFKRATSLSSSLSSSSSLLAQCPTSNNSSSISSNNMSALSLPLCLQTSVAIERGRLHVVVGPVGAGKSALTLALLGELHHITGHIQGPRTVALATQTAWLASGSVRDNILFGDVFSPGRYRAVVDACGLAADLACLPGGDQYHVGELGGRLSGGQRQRIALARAAYRDADLYLLDEPLSGVDGPLVRDIWAACMRGLLRGRTVVVITHHMECIANSDVVLLVDNGHVRRLSIAEYLHACPPSPSATMIAHQPASSDHHPANNDSDGDSHCQHTPSPSPSPPPAPASAAIPPPLAFPPSALPSEACAAGSLDASISTSAVLAPVRDHSHMCAAVAVNTAIPAHTDDPFNTSFLFPLSTDVSIAPLHPTCQPPSRLHSLPLNASLPLPLVLPKMPPSPMRLGRGRESGMQLDDSRSFTGPVLTTADWSQTRRALKAYCKRAGGTWSLAQCVGLHILARAGILASGFYLVCWTDHCLHHPDAYYILFYNIILLISGLLAFTGFLLSFSLLLRASHRLHDAVTQSLLHTNLAFFQTTTFGQILSRFALDAEVVDTQLPGTVQDVVLSAILVGSVFLMIASVTIWATAPLAAILLAFHRIQRKYRPASLFYKMAEAHARARIDSHLAECVAGTLTVRHMGRAHVLASLRALLNTHTTAFYSSFAVNRWLGANLELLGAFVVLTAAVSSVVFHDTLGVSLAGFLVTSSLAVSTNLSCLVRYLADMEVMLHSVDRLQDYIALPAETWRPVPVAMDERWPAAGAITFNDVTIVYPRQAVPALSRTTLHIPARQKVALVGRTGAGKSTIALALFRLLEPATGVITIDGADISQVPLDRLRERMAYLPQTPALLAGSLRLNLDPHATCHDAAIWAALENVQMKTRLAVLCPSLDDHLDATILSLGEQQLVCLARVLLRDPRIVVMDEASAALDPLTDHTVRSCISNHLRDCTVLTIAHRLAAVRDCERVIVLHQGRVVADGPVAELDHLRGSW